MTAAEWGELLPIMREHFAAERERCVALGLREAAADEEAWAYVRRLQAWRRRGAEARACGRCQEPVLWRREDGVSRMIDKRGRVHACPSS